MRLRGGFLALALAVAACATPTTPPDGPDATLSGSGEGRTGGRDARPKADPSPVTLAEPVVIKVLGPAAGILSNHGARAISNNGGQVVSNQGGQLISDKGTGLTGKTKYALAQANALFGPAAKASVVVTDLQGRALSGPYVSADDQGEARITRLAAGDVVIAYGSLKLEGFDVLLSAIVPAPGSGGAVDIDPATTLVTKRLQALAALGELELAKIPPTLPRDLARAIAPHLTAELVAGAAVLDAQGAAEAFDAVAATTPAMLAAIKALPAMATGDLGTAFVSPVPKRPTPGPLAGSSPGVPGTSPAPSEFAASPSPLPSPTPTPTPTPLFTAFEPESALPGQTLALAVKDLAPGGATVTIGGKPAAVTTASATRLEVTVPTGLEEGTVAVTAGGVTLQAAAKLDIVEQVGVYDAGASPGALAVDISGTLWIANGDGKVTRLAQAGTPLGTFAVEASPRRLVGAPDGSIWVSCGSGKVVKLDPFGAKVGSYDAGPDPWGLAVDETGDVWVVNKSAQTLTLLDGTTGAVERTASVSVPQPEDLAWDAAGDLWISHAEAQSVTRSQVFAATGVKGGASAPGGVLVAPDGKVQVAFRGADKVGRLQDLATALWSVAVPDEPVAVGAGGEGDVWVACGAGGRLVRLAASDGHVRGTFPYTDGLAGLVVDPSGNVWATRALAGKVVKLLP